MLVAAVAVSQVGKFGAVGIINTVLDFALFNLLSSGTVGLSKIKANIISTTIAMTFSFFANQRFVFAGGGGDQLRQAFWFVAVTAFGLYILQNLVIYLLTGRWRWPRRLVDYLLRLTRLRRLLKTDFALKNGAKLAATLVSLTWNFVLYKRLVFR